MRNKTVKLKVVSCAFLFIGFLTGSAAARDNDSIPVHETFTIPSTYLNEVRVINVWTPPEYTGSGNALPVMYMLDGGLKEDFPHIAQTLAHLVETKQIQPIILVGIENTQRRRDLTGPTTVKTDKKIAPVVGGSEAFRKFIRDELFAEIHTRYSVNPRKGIIGESLAGLFIVETLLLEPDMFDFYIAFDPSLWWNNTYLLKMAGTYLDKLPATKKTLWFAGSKTKGIYANARKLAGILTKRNPASLRWSYSPEPKEKHWTIFKATKERAIVWTLSNL